MIYFLSQGHFKDSILEAFWLEENEIVASGTVSYTGKFVWSQVARVFELLDL